MRTVHSSRVEELAVTVEEETEVVRRLARHQVQEHVPPALARDPEWTVRLQNRLHHVSKTPADSGGMGRTPEKSGAFVSGRD